MARLDRLQHDDRWFRSKIGVTQVVAYTGASARTTVLTPGLYRIACSTDAHIRQGDSTVAATTSDMPLYIGQVEYAQVDTWVESGGSNVTPFDGVDNFIAAIRQTANGNLYVSLLSRLTSANP